MGENETTQERPWANLFFMNKMAMNGMNLSYIAPVVVEGEKIIEILSEDTEKLKRMKNGNHLWWCMWLAPNQQLGQWIGS